MLLDPLLARWQALDERERLLVAAGGGLLTVILMVLLLWQPVRDARQELTQRLDGELQTLARMELGAREVQHLRKNSVAIARLAPNDSLLALTERSVRAEGLATVLQRVEPEGDNKVRLWFEGAPFTTLLTWLGTLRNRFGVTAITVTIEKTAKPGLVNAQLLIILQTSNGDS
ncbi:MAG: type II secretion system protein M [Magnetococcales bacterium]|nr:type II secretion system protein M [Magnetococcales bacterium]